MNRPRHVKWLLLLFFVIQSTGYSYAQSAPAAKHRWSSLSIKFSGDQAKKYAHLPQAEYTPLNQLENWAAGKAVQQYAKEVNGTFLLQYMLLVDNKGVIREIEVIKTDNARHADALKGLLLNTKTQGPSFVQNKAVTCYVPCAIKIDGRLATIL
ncbi:hypothetical protein [Chitinophaga alhagiae]|uniref:hypothetical protein n=1 Tax=Chitinophaga alhagiae TaxID=2203219 RepID=UPI0013003D90|nr:hypothetical protein [Chitinophaga alhagiae]